jgi:hypothetical protein
MTGSEFAKTFARRGPLAWEPAALDLARQGGLTPWPMVPISLVDDRGNHAVLQVSSDVLSVGPIEDHLRLPLTPSAAQDVLNLTGALLPTPLLAYRIWRQAPVKLTPTSIADLGQTNKVASMEQYVLHSGFVDRQIAALLASVQNRAPGPGPELVASQKKDVVVSNIMAPGRVVIFGEYRPPPAPDVFDDGRPLVDGEGRPVPNRQPIQPKSNIHAAAYVDYSHGIRAVGPVALVNGVPMRTTDLYQHPDLWRLVSSEGPLRSPRYPSRVPPADPMPQIPPEVVVRAPGVDVVATSPSAAEVALAEIEARRL